MLSVLNQPVREGALLGIEYFIKRVQRIVSRMRGAHIPRYTGHAAVTRSIVEGLQKLHADFNYNPSHLGELGSHVFVPGGHLALRQAIRLRRRGVIRRLLVGPNICILPSDMPKLVGAPEIDLFLCNSPWTRDMYVEDLPSLAGRCGIWPAGVDTDFWAPSGSKPEKLRALFFRKRPPVTLFDECVQRAQRAGFEVEVLVTGKYNLDGYRNALHRSNLLVHFVEQESQGISLAESWASDTPTLVWNPEWFHWQGKNFPTSSAPYLTKRTGLFFRTAVAFSRVLEEARHSTQFAPRAWVLENMSDEACAQRLLDLMFGVNPAKLDDVITEISAGFFL